MCQQKEDLCEQGKEQARRDRRRPSKPQSARLCPPVQRDCPPPTADPRGVQNSDEGGYSGKRKAKIDQKTQMRKRRKLNRDCAWTRPPLERSWPEKKEEEEPPRGRGGKLNRDCA